MTLLHAQEFLWTPKVKDRPRHRKNSASTYTPQKTEDAEAAFLKQYTGDCYDGPLAVEYHFMNERVYMEIRTAAEHTQRKLRGDTDNYLKLVTDALNKHAWTDDRQIVDLRGVKA